MRLSHKTIPLLLTATIQPAPELQTNRLEPIAELGRIINGGFACLILLVALVGLIASFSWGLGRPQSCRMVKTSHLKNLTTCREASTPLAFLPMLRGLAAKFIMKCIATLDEYDIDELAREISGETDDDLACKLHEEACIIREVYPSFGYNVQAHLLNIQLKSTTKQSEANVFPRANIVRWFQS